MFREDSPGLDGWQPAFLDDALALAGADGRGGVCVWLTGLPCSGKTTTALALAAGIVGQGRQVTLLDGDIVRAQFARGLGFSRAERDANVHFVGRVAAEMAWRGGIVICALVSPYAAARDRVRGLVEPAGFVEVFVDTPLEVAEARDVKGMYARARRGEIAGFTGVNDPYEAPLRPEITLDTVGRTPAENAARIARYIQEKGWLRDGAAGAVLPENFVLAAGKGNT